MARNKFCDIIVLDPDPHTINADPHHWIKLYMIFSYKRSLYHSTPEPLHDRSIPAILPEMTESPVKSGKNKAYHWTIRPCAIINNPASHFPHIKIDIFQYYMDLCMIFKTIFQQIF